VLLTLAAVLALDGADKGSVGAMAEPLQHAFHIGTTDFGLLLTVSLGTAAGATFVFGSFVDRTNRVRLLAWTTAGWAVAIALSACATSYLFLLLSRIALGAITASAAPAIASLIGDYFPTQERGGVYSSVLGGEVLGSGAGFLLSGELANWTWRAAFGALAILAVVLARVVHALPEPRRGGGGSFSSRRQKHHQSSSSSKQIVRESGAPPRPELVLKKDPSDRSLWWVLRYVLRVPTNRILIVASALAYFYFTGLRAFGVEYLRVWLRVGHTAAVILMILAGSGALVGVLISGRSADRLLAGGRPNARILVACVAYFATTGLFALSLLTRAIWLELPLLVLAAAALGAISPPLDAARLDIMHPSLWGRAESVRTCLRKAAEAAAPISFGYVAEHVYGHATGGGLHATFFLMLIALGVGGGVGLFALRSYPRDVATVVASRTT